MEWQAVVMAVQIMLLATGWVLFQKARAELSAKAAEEPVLSEVRALQRQVKALLAEIEQAGETATARLESQCAEARSLLEALERRSEVAALPSEPRPALPKRSRRAPSAPTLPQEIPQDTPAAVVRAADPPPVSEPPSTARRRETIYALADTGATPSSIARQTGLSEGEVETLLGLRRQKQ
jgi:hypothetical protein